jgi:hypothetical protein
MPTITTKAPGQTRRAALLAAAHQAFSPRALSAEEVARGPSEEAAGIRRAFGGRTWSEVSRQSISAEADLLPQDLPAFLSDEGVAAYLPLLLDMATDLGSPFDIADELSLTLRSRPLEILELLERGQRRVVLDALEWLADELSRSGVPDSGARRTLDEIGSLFADGLAPGAPSSKNEAT